MRYTGLQVCALVALTACAGAQAAPTPATTPSPRAQERATRDQEVAVRVRERSEQARLRSERARLRADSARVRAQARALAADSALMNRASIGVTLSNTGNRRDTLGIFVSAVAAGGPAERAGIVEGDRIASINGVDVRTQPSDAEDSYLAGVAQRRFTLELRKLTPGQRANLRVWSGGRYREVQVTTARYPEVYRNRRSSIRIGDGTMWLPGLIPGVPAAPLGPGRTELRTLPHVAPLRRLELDAGKLEASLGASAQDVAEMSARMAELTGEAVATALAPLGELEEIEFQRSFAPLADLEETLLELEPFADDPFEFDWEFELDDHPPMEVEIDDLSVEALRQAGETIGTLERQVTSR